MCFQRSISEKFGLPYTCSVALKWRKDRDLESPSSCWLQSEKCYATLCNNSLSCMTGLVVLFSFCSLLVYLFSTPCFLTTNCSMFTKWQYGESLIKRKKLNFGICQVSLANNFGHVSTFGRGKRGAAPSPHEFLIMINELLYYWEHNLMAIQLNIYLWVYLVQLTFFLSYRFLHCILSSTVWSS